MQSRAARLAGVLALALSVAACNTTGQGGLEDRPALDGRVRVHRRTAACGVRTAGPQTQSGSGSSAGSGRDPRGLCAVSHSRLCRGWCPARAGGGVLGLGCLRCSGRSNDAPERRGKASKAGRDALGPPSLTRSWHGSPAAAWEQLSVYFRNPDAAPAAAVVASDPPVSGPVMPRTDDFRPETYGITRRSQEGAASAAAAAPNASPSRRSGARMGTVAQAE